MSEAPEKILVDTDEAQYLCADKFPDHPEDVPGVEYTRSDLIPQWQDIETAPYDTLILVIREDGNIFQHFWYDEDMDSFKRADSPGSGLTHWMPLPQPPKQNS